MVEVVSNTIDFFFSTDRGFVVYFALVTVMAVFLFWRSVRRTSYRDALEKEVPSGEDMAVSMQSFYGIKVFDLLIISGVIAVVTSRVVFLLANPDILRSARWFLLPYEKIGGEVFLFDSLPWLIFHIWNGGMLIDGLVLGWLVSLTGISRVMKIKWGSISNALSDFFWALSVGVEIYTAVRWKSMLALGIAVGLIVLGFARLWANVNRRKRGAKRVHRIISSFWKVGTVVGVPAILLVNNLAIEESDYTQLAVVVDVIAIVAAFWILSGDLLEFFNVLTSRKEAEGGPIRDEVLTETSPVGRALSGGDAGWRKYASTPHKPHRVPSTEVRRSFSRTYSDFSSRWLSRLKSFIPRLRKQREARGTDANIG